jgi:hypothetical protein
MEIPTLKPASGKVWMNFHDDLSVFAVWIVDSWWIGEVRSNYVKWLLFRISRLAFFSFRDRSARRNWYPIDKL